VIRIFPLTIACIVALTSDADGAPRNRRPPPERAQSSQSAAQEQDEFRSCDVAVRDFVQGRKEATALPVKDIEVDGLRMTLNFVHPYGQSGDTPPNLAFTRGESIEERRRNLNETKQRIRTHVEAAKTGNVWYVIAVNKDNSDGGDMRRSPVSAQPVEDRPSASAVVMASIEGKCITVADYKAVPLTSLGEELRRILGDQSLGPPPVADSTPPP
jgi:hypothetical protein